MEYNIGDKVWHARIQWVQDYLPCPHCFGNLYLTVILGNNEQITIDCECCRNGWMGSQGKIRVGQYRADVHLCTVDRKEQSMNKIEYRVDGYIVTENEIFINKEDAQVRASEIALEQRAEEMQRFYNKEKNDRNWAWNATYHRNNVKKLSQELAYHISKLDIAKIKSKEKC